MRKTETKLESTVPVTSPFKAIVSFLIGLFCIMTLGCVSVSEKGSHQSDTFVTCTEPRPEMCTQEYVPVCGYLVDGSQKTYSNACSACSDKKTIKYLTTPCP